MALRTNFGTQPYFGFDPRTIPGCALWLDAADSNTFTFSSGSNISSWRDKSSNALTGTALNSPTQTANSINGLPGVVFSTGTQYIDYGNNLNLGLNGVYVFTAVKYDVTGDGAIIGKSRNAGLAGRWSLLRQAAGGGMLMLADAAGSGFVATYTDTSTSPQLVTGFWDRANVVIRRNGTHSNSVALANTASSYSTSDLLYVGAYQSTTGGAPPTAGLFLNGKIGEIIVYVRSAMTAFQIQQVEGYLAWKWGLQANLPTGHPFRPNPNFQRMPQPPDFGPMLFWWDAAEYSSFTPANPTTGTSITGWRDKIGNLTISNSNASPTWTSNGLNFSNPVSTISANTQNMWYSNASSPYTITQNFNVFVAHTPNSFNGFQLVFSLLAPVDLAGPNGFTAWVQCGSNEGNTIGVLSNGNWRSLQQAGFSSTTLGQPRIESLLSAPSNFAWTNGTENTFSIENIGRGTATSGTSVVSGISMSSVSNSLGSRAYNGIIHEILVYSSNLSPSAIRQVEGYLGWKWKAYRNLVNTHPFYNIPTSSPLFTPPSISGLMLWLDAADSSTLTLSGSNITQWNDKSGSNYNFQNNATLTPWASASSNRPTYNTQSGLNGLPVVSFDSAINQSLAASDVFGGTATQSFTMFLITTSRLGRGIDTYGNGWSINFPSYNSGNQNYVFTSAGTAGYALASTSSNSPLWTQTLSQTASSVATFWNAGTQTATSNISNTSLRSSTVGFTLGITQGSNLYYSGYFGEVIIYDSVLSTPQRHEVEGYLAWKWGLQNNLPTTHPYYKFRP
jgi:hypothetical protein